MDWLALYQDNVAVEYRVMVPASGFAVGRYSIVAMSAQLEVGTCPDMILDAGT